MPTLTLRSVGVSYLIEGVEPSGLDPRMLLDALTGAYGLAVAPLSTPRTLQPLHDDDESSIDAMIVDRRAVPWDDLRSWLEDYVRSDGSVYAAWADDGRTQMTATLHFHRL